jgi:uncharacterized protein (UPF0548 family)
MSGAPKRRATAIEDDRGLNYTVIGATLSPDVVAFPPAGFRPNTVSHRLGSGAPRFEIASRHLMTWGVMTSAGVDVDEIVAEPARSSARGVGPLFLDDGTPWITPGMTAVLSGSGTPVIDGPIKVVTVLEEPGRVGFVWGSRPGHAAAVERLFLLEHEDDDSVVFTVRSISRPAGGRNPLVTVTQRSAQQKADERFAKALHPARAA